MPTFPLTVRAPDPYEPPEFADGELVEITDHLRDGLSVLISEYKDSPRLQAWIGAFLKQMQAIESDVIAMQTLVSIEDSEGAQLDKLGGILGEGREGRSDTGYRRGLRTRILVNKSSGKLEELIEIIRRWHGTGDEVTVRAREAYPAHMTFNPRPTTVDAPGLFRRLRQAKLAGVSITLVHETSPYRAFRWSSQLGTREPAPLTGMGYTSGTVGGLLQYAVG